MAPAHERPRLTRRLTQTPRIGRYYWVDFPADHVPPEFVEPHPGIIIRAAQTLDGTCIIVPVTTKPQTDLRHAHPLARNPNPNDPHKQAWAVCNHLYTLHVSRLRPVWNKLLMKNDFPKVDEADMQGIYACIRNALFNVFPVTTTVIAETTTQTTVKIVEAG